MKNSISVAIGRNRHDDGVAMDDESWHDFQRQVRLLFVGGEMYSQTDGIGEYDNVKEESVVFTGASDFRSETIREWLADLAYRFGQESIGLILQEGTDTLVFAKQDQERAA